MFMNHFELRNKSYNFRTNIMMDDDKEKILYESDICSLLNEYEEKIRELEGML